MADSLQQVRDAPKLARASGLYFMAIRFGSAQFARSLSLLVPDSYVSHCFGVCVSLPLFTVFRLASVMQALLPLLSSLPVFELVPSNAVFSVRLINW